jgi:transcriptional regulator with XRE-family HTH domain
MSQRFPVTARGAEAPVLSVLGPAFDLDRRGNGAGPPPAANEVRMSRGPTAAELTLPLLFLPMQVTGHRELGEELGRRDVLRRPPHVRGGLALGHAHGNEPHAEADGRTNQEAVEGKEHEPGRPCETRLTRVYVTRLEAGSQDPSLNTINSLAKALGVPVTELLE